MSRADRDRKLNPNQVHLWFAFPDEIEDPELLSRYEKILADDELVRQGRFRFDRHRHRFLVARALVRSVLSRYADIEPDRWRFCANKYGKPEISRSMNRLGIRFNLSHTAGLIVCGVALNRDIGVDVENIERQSKTDGIASRYFSPEEIADLETLDETERKERFYRYWTLKESYVKARGIGLSLPLDRFAFHLKENEPIRISFAPDMNDDPDRWQFKLFEPLSNHPAAVSVERPAGADCEFETWKTVPLSTELPFPCEL